MAFLMTAGMLPLYSGVTTSAASASAAAARSAVTEAGASAFVVDVLVVERQLTELIEDGDGDAVWGDSAASSAI